MKLAMVRWRRGGRSALVAALPSDPTRLVDLHAIEEARLVRLGEGRPGPLAQTLVPPDLGLVLEGGPRAFHRLGQALAYAEKWHRRGDLPTHLAPRWESATFLPCLGRPRALWRWDGTSLDARAVQGPGTALEAYPQPTLAALGMAGGRPAGFCLALPQGGGAVLGAWLWVDAESSGRLASEGSSTLELRAGNQLRSAPVDIWEGLTLGLLGPREVALLPPPRLRRLSQLRAGDTLEVAWAHETLPLRVGSGLAHPTVQ